MKRPMSLDAPESIEVLQDLWALRDLTMAGVADRWSAFHRTEITVGMLRGFVGRRREQFPDRRVLNGGSAGAYRRAPRRLKRVTAPPVEMPFVDAEFDAVGSHSEF